jgi:glutaredoxin
VTHVLALVAVLALTGLLAVVYRARDGQVRATAERFARAELDALGAPAVPLLALVFTAPSCGPCAAAQRVLAEVTARRAGVAVHAVDVADAPDVARAHHVLRAPTVFVVEASGRVRGRVSGVPDAGALGALLDQRALTRAGSRGGAGPYGVE